MIQGIIEFALRKPILNHLLLLFIFLLAIFPHPLFSFHYRTLLKNREARAENRDPSKDPPKTKDQDGLLKRTQHFILK